MRKPELLAPGGSFVAAYHAFEAGADGVYLGLKEFSARKAAQNFTLDQLRRLRRLAADRGRKVYVAVNTVIREAELGTLSETLAWLEALEVDAVIVQDLGVLGMIARCFPRLTIHASTQMALHNEAGLRMAQELGVRRVILPRELPVERIRALREKVPEMELEVFIHGALCYSFSGVCLASWSLTGRSGNRGDCAQICRSRFTSEQAGDRGAGARGAEPAGPCDGHLFSCRDLFLGKDVLKLAETGVDAFKIEGRMKSPEYVFNVTRLYREVIDRGPDIDDDEYSELTRRAELGFSREKTSAWLHSSSGARLVDPSFPGHRGAPLGTVTGTRGRQITLRLGAELSIRDGLGFIAEGSREMSAFPVTTIRRGGRQVRTAREGETVQVQVPPDLRLPLPGTEIRHLSSRFLDLRQPREKSFPLYRVPREVDVTLDADGTLTLRSPGTAGFATRLTVEKAQQRNPFVGILTALLEEPGESLFEAVTVSFQNRSGLDGDGIFVPPSQLKKAKNDFYSFLDAGFRAGLTSRADPPRPFPAYRPGVLPEERALLSERHRISPPVTAPVPFVDADPSRLDAAGLASLAGRLWLPLPPVILDEGGWTGRLQAAAQEARLRGVELAVGLNNLSHLALAAGLADEPGISFFIDIYLYAANSGTLAAVRERVPRLLFAYAWVEGSAEDARALDDAAAGLPVLRVASGFQPPLFWSLGCFAKHVLNPAARSGARGAPGRGRDEIGRCFEDCPKDFSLDLRQGKNAFRVVVRDCVTWLFRSDGGRA